MVIHGDAKAICAAYVKARGDMSATVIKDAKGNFGKYATLAAIVEAITPHLAKHGLAVVQEASTDEQGIVIETWLVHETGAMMQFTPLPLPLTDRKPQAVGSALTYGRRYALAAICGLAPDDDDGQAAQDAQNAPQRALATPASKHTRHAPTTPQDASTPTSKPRATHEQVHDLDTLGVKFYGGKQWPAERTRLSKAASKGAVQQPTELMESEIAKLIKGLTDEIAKAEQQPEASLANAEAIPH